MVIELAKFMQMQKRPNMAAIFRELSNESGIPATTLRNWWYKLKKAGCTENGTDEQPSETNKNPQDESPDCPEICTRDFFYNSRGTNGLD